ncbi:MAG: ribosome small subunit-dependent GTPase A [Bacteroidales bacterium]|nr:ribosome small subunit-dependent GTPase A [Bacteroidales bacterium]MCF8456510.1 ribosome small subunit-dependent GTPase A [Bacteroidales bacterium]
MENTFKGLVIKSTGSWYRVLAADKKLVDCKFKGKYRIKGIRSTNPIAVGDHVQFIVDSTDGTGTITEIEDRKNYIIRRSTNLSKETQIIAANIDLAFLIVTIAFPDLRIGFVDRFLASAEAYRTPVQILFNKVDLYTQKQLMEMEKLTEIYEKVGYSCLAISATQGKNIQVLKERIAGNVCVFSGNSGVGKSTLANVIDPSLNLKTDEISDAHKKGKHTTTFAQMYPLENGSFLIDTPGIKGFGVFDFDKDEVFHFFPEIFKASHYCQYNNCSHTHEPKCAVKLAVEDGEISESRYTSYLNILFDENDKHRQKGY